LLIFFFSHENLVCGKVTKSGGNCKNTKLGCHLHNKDTKKKPNKTRKKKAKQGAVKVVINQPDGTEE